MKKIRIILYLILAGLLFLLLKSADAQSGTGKPTTKFCAPGLTALVGSISLIRF